MPLDDVLDLSLVDVVGLVLLDLQDDLGAAAERLAGVLGDGELAARSALPHVLLVVVVLGDDAHAVCNEVRRVEADAELADHGDVSRALGELLHELLGAGAGDGAEAVDEVSLGHADAGIPDGDGAGLLVGDDADPELGLAVEHGLVGEALVADLVEGIAGVADELTKEDVLVAVERVDDEAEQLVQICGELELLTALNLHFLLFFCHF